MNKILAIIATIAFITFNSAPSAAQAGSPALSIPGQIPSLGGGLVTVPVSFIANGNSISTVVFSIDYDQALLTLNAADGNADGIPDSINITAPASFSGSVTFDPGDTDGELDISIADMTSPLSSLSNGVVMTITFSVGSPQNISEATVNFSLNPMASYGSSAGQSVGGTATGGSVLITPSSPTVEANCFDGMDNDSDGLADCADSDCAGATDGACATGVPGICSAGTLTCQGGTAVCVANSQPQAELCDGVDNDCNGVIDNGFNIGLACTAGTGSCMNSGQFICRSDGSGTVCNVTPLPAGIEGPAGDPTCTDSVDNDCDGLLDAADTAGCTAGQFVLPPPVNQKIGIPDSVFNSLDEQGCRQCHDNEAIVPPPSNLNRHHLRYGKPLEAGFCSVNNAQACTGDNQCSTGICSVSGAACAVDGDCPIGQTCGELCIGDSVAPYQAAPDGTYQCLTCHVINEVSGVYDIDAVRDCLSCHEQLNGEVSVHHFTAKAQSGDCKVCHGNVVNNIDDGHLIPGYAPSLLTPKPSGGVGAPFNVEGSGQGACNYCHSTGTGFPGSVAPGMVTDPLFTGPFGPVMVYRNTETHHSTGLGYYDNSQCLWCHNMDNVGEAPIRRCEGCHGLESLHNIAIDSDDPDNVFTPNGENPGWSHIGSNQDCWGCHGYGAAAASAPYSGPTVPVIDRADIVNVLAGTDTQITLTGTGFVNTMNGVTYSAIVSLSGSTGIPVQVTPESVSESTLVFTVPGTTAAGNYEVRALKEDKQSNPAVISIVPDVTITFMKCDTKARLLTINGMNFGDQYSGAENYINVEVNGVVVTPLSWSNTQIVVPVADCRLEPLTQVKALYGAEERLCSKGCVEKKRRRR
ncbi:MAG: hypothetical protein JSU90_11730 [Nitrospiraceae bacterium]|nr:MAG: hypothetical protein JSU90_11730 [Nitrospiraceae bacterium]